MKDSSSKTRSSVSRTTDLAYIAVFTALTVVLGFVSIPIGTVGVPIVLQNAVLILSGLVLGARRGLYVALLFLLLGLVGLPVLAGGRSALVAFAGPTAGYLIGYVVSAWVAGLIAFRAPRQKAAMTATLILAACVGTLIQLVFGAVGLMIRSGLDATAAAAAQVPFLLPGLLKIVIIVAIAAAVHSAFPDLMRRRAKN